MKGGPRLKEDDPTLYIVPTPIGNLEDMTFRAVRVLRSVSCILAEDTRQSGILCRHHEIFTRRVSFNEHNGAQRIPWIIDEMKRGASFALVSDAGCPGISDPGQPLIREVVASSLRLEVLPGPSAVPTALAGSGFVANSFLFEGFLPRKGKERQAILQALATERRTMVLFESPVRLVATLEDLARIMGLDRRAVVARELTKIHETWHRGSLKDLVEGFVQTPPRGEMVIVIEGAVKRLVAVDPEEIDLLIDGALAEGMGVKEIARSVAERTSSSLRDAYDRVLRRKPSP
ncbi:MAG: 16S rRNA (cytidine(1402)-2'-O)-methyltransferase [Magnetococcales bacterium]|nr:16S rRNA (cytidine(1402)-2'-O)-methyltransferase [Magnetococcales bacterium]